MAQPIALPQFKDLPKIRFSSGGSNIDAGKYLLEQKRAKQKYEDAIDAKMWTEFKEIVDIDKPLAVAQGAQKRQAEVVEKWSDEVADVYANTDGSPSQKQLMEIEQSAQKIEEQLARVKAWEDNWNKDMAIVSRPGGGLSKLDIESAKSVWDYDFTAPYESTRLRPRRVTGSEIATNTKNEFLGKDSQDSYSAITNNKYKDRVDFDKDYYNVDAVGKPISLNYDAIKDFNDKAVFADDFKTYSIMQEFDELGEVDQRRYINMAENGDESKAITGSGDKNDAMKYYYLDKYAADEFGMKETRTQLTPRKSGDGYKNGYRYERGAYQLDESQGITFKSPEGEYSSDNYYAMPGVTRSGVINNPIDMDKGDDLGKTMTLPVGSTHKIVGVDFDAATGEKMNHYQVKMPSQDLKNANGDIIYTSPRYGEGTEEELKEKFLEQSRNNNEYTEAKSKNKKKLDARYLGDWGFVAKDLKPKTEKAHTRNVYAPAKNNPVDSKKYKVANEPKIEVKTYTIKGTNYPAEAIAKAAEQSGMSVEEYITEANK